jgi:hypothetical protein
MTLSTTEAVGSLTELIVSTAGSKKEFDMIEELTEELARLDGSLMPFGYCCS